MALEQYRPEDFEHMKVVERKLVDTLQPFTVNTPPALMVLTLIRCARVILRKCDPGDQKFLLPVLIAFLEGKMRQPGDPSLIWLPEEPRRRH